MLFAARNKKICEKTNTANESLVKLVKMRLVSVLHPTNLVQGRSDGGK